MKNKISRRGFLKAASASAALSAAALLGTGCSASAAGASSVASGAAAAPTAEPAKASAPKHIFLFIGDGCGQVQMQLASYYQGALHNDGAVVKEPLGFMAFPQVGTVTTFDSSSFCPDSASTATSIATGKKTLSGVINMDPETKAQAYETISEKLHSQLGYKVGVISTVNINHATPAAFYAHQSSRKNYYAIGEELCESGFEFFAGGGFLSPKDKDEDKTDILEVAANAGYTVATTQVDAKALAAGSKALIIAETLADGAAMSYAMDAAAGEWQLTDYVKKGIELLDGGDGFFMMAESGKIDWACHANDAAASIHDVLEMDNAVAAALDYYKQHKEDTLILVTADHETGGQAIGYATTNYNTFLNSLSEQTMSYAKFDADYVAKYVENKTGFEAAMADVKSCFGLVLPGDADATEDNVLVLTDWEAEELKTAYKRTLEVGAAGQGDMTQRDYERYGTYVPFSMTICHMIDQKCGVGHTTYAHTGAPVSLYAIGCGAESFAGNYDNTEIYQKLAALTGVQ